MPVTATASNSPTPFLDAVINGSLDGIGTAFTKSFALAGKLAIGGLGKSLEVADAGLSYAVENTSPGLSGGTLSLKDQCAAALVGTDVKGLNLGSSKEAVEHKAVDEPTGHLVKADAKQWLDKGRGGMSDL